MFISSKAFSGAIQTVNQQVSLSPFSQSVRTHTHTHTHTRAHTYMKEPKLISGVPKCHWVCWKMASMQGWHHDCYYIWMLPSLENCSNLVIQEQELSHFSQLVIKTPYIHCRLICQHLIKTRDLPHDLVVLESPWFLLNHMEQFCQKKNGKMQVGASKGERTLRTWPFGYAESRFPFLFVHLEGGWCDTFCKLIKIHAQELGTSCTQMWVSTWQVANGSQISQTIITFSK